MKTDEAHTMLTFIKFHVLDIREKVDEQLKVIKKEMPPSRVARSTHSADSGSGALSDSKGVRVSRAALARRASTRSPTRDAQPAG
mmetsp:Transcript_32152/g.81824  ORF Transcript_32152/g.81824 Transcript_32152/m.81824 type:complete len:85 (+) Transcript_32152:3-257(+)